MPFHEADITQALRRHAQTRGADLATADVQITLTWAQLDAEVDAAAAQVVTAGVQTGDRIAICLPDTVQTLTVILAVLRLGAVHAPIDVHLAAPEIEAAIQAVQAQWFISGAGSGWTCRNTGIAAIPDPLAPQRSAFIRLTSGTTGMAKGVLLSHRTLTERIAAANIGLQLGPDDRVLWLLPMAYHVAVSVLLYVEVGATIIFGNRLRAGETAKVATVHQCTFAYGSPWHVRRCAELPAGSWPDSLRRMVSTTTALDADSAALMQSRHGIPVLQALGIIECGLPLLSTGALGEPVGRFQVQAAYYAAIHDVAGRAVADGGAGDLVLSGPGFLDAYLQPWRARAAILVDGWFRTGDVACRQTDGSIQLLGRSSDVINIGGMKVFPLEVEAVLDAHSLVVACRVFGAPDPRTGEQVVAEVQLTPSATTELAVAALHTWCAARLAPLKRPAVITVVDKLAMTASGKVRR